MKTCGIRLKEVYNFADWIAGVSIEMSIEFESVEEMMNKWVPFHLHLGMTIVSMKEGYARMELSYRDEFIGDPRRPALHGGLISTLVDSCGGAAVWSKIDTNDRVSTVDLRVDFLRPGPPEDLICEAGCLRVGNMVGVSEMSVFTAGDPERIIATGKGVYNIYHPK